jgi:hypothetical protein
MYLNMPSDLPFRDFPTRQVTPTQFHKTNSLEFSTLDGLSFPSFELNNNSKKVPFNESTSSIQWIELDTSVASKQNRNHEGSTTDISVTSWSNLDLCIPSIDSEGSNPVTGNTEKQIARKCKRPTATIDASAANTNQQSLHTKVSRPPESPIRRLVRRISQNRNDSAADTSKKQIRRFSLSHTDHSKEGHNTKSFLSPKSQLRKQISAFDLCTPRSTEIVSPKKVGRKVLLNCSEGIKSEAESIVSPLSPLKKQNSGIELSTPERHRSCFPRRRAQRDSENDTLSPCDNLMTSTFYIQHEDEWTPPCYMSPTKNSIHSPSKQVSERVMSSPKWVELNQVGGNGGLKKASIPKVDSVQILLSEFDKIMELP